MTAPSSDPDSGTAPTPDREPDAPSVAEPGTGTGTGTGGRAHGIGDGESRSGRGRLGVLGVLVALLVAALGASAWLQTTAGPDPDDVQAEREVVMDRARQFMLRVNTYGPDDLAEDGTMPDYREQVSELITPKFRTDFEQNVEFAEQTVAQAGLARSAQVHGVGVSALDEDSATVLVAGSFTNSYPRGGAGEQDDRRIEDRPAPFRVEVELVHTGGEWLVDTFTPVTGEGEQ